MNTNQNYQSKNSLRKIEINLEKDICITGVTKVIESSDKRLVLNLNNSKMILDGNNFQILNIDIENKLLHASGTVNRYKIINNKILSKLY